MFQGATELNLDSKGELVGSLANFSLDTPGKLRTPLFRAKQDLERIAANKGHKGPPQVVVVLRADQNGPATKVWEVPD